MCRRLLLFLGRLVAVAVAAAVGGVGGVLLAGSAAAATCAQVRIDPGVQSPTLNPASVTITAGGCVAYTNNTQLTVSVTVGKVSGKADPNAAVTFREPVAGSFAVKAQQQFQGQPVGGTGSGTLVVRAAPAPSPSHSASPPPAHRPTPTPATSQSSGPQVAPGSLPPVSPPPTLPGITPVATIPPGQVNPPVVVGIPTPTPTPSASSSAAVVVGQLQPPSGRAFGLPAAVAALLVVGAATAFLRVLLAEPVGTVDDRRFVVRPS